MSQSGFAPLVPEPSTARCLESVAPAGYRRSVVQWLDRATDTHRSLDEVWRRLETGTDAVFDHFLTAERCFIVLRARPQCGLRPNEQRAVDVLRKVLLAGSQKVVGYEEALCPSSIAQQSRHALLTLGIHGRVQDTPFVLVAAAHSADKGRPLSARRRPFRCGDVALDIFSIPRPEAEIRAVLSPAVLDVTRSMIEGMQRSVIARIRNRSERTVSNQLACAFRQLRATSRLDLLRVLAAPRSVVA